MAPPVSVPMSLRVEIIVERRSEKVNKSRSGRQGMKERELLQKYGSQAKVDKLKGILKSKGMFEEDPDFPGDEEEWGGCWKWHGFLENMI